MVRECAAALLILPAAGCSLLLDFSDEAVPRDAAPDAPYSQADCDYKEPDDTLDTAAVIAPADTGPAAICASAQGDHDFYRFTVPAMTARVEIKIALVAVPGGDLDLALHDTAGATLSASHNFGGEERITCPGASPACGALAAGDYVFEVYPGVAGAANRYTFSLSFTAQ
jgi:hypothetical protein